MRLAIAIREHFWWFCRYSAQAEIAGLEFMVEGAEANISNIQDAIKRYREGRQQAFEEINQAL